MNRLTVAALVTTAMVLVEAGSAVASVTEVTISKGHHLYGVRHTLSKNKRRATTHTVAGQCIAAPTEEDKSRLDVGACTHIADGIYEFDLFAHSSASDGDYTVQFVDQTTHKPLTGGRNLPRNLTVHVKDIVVVSVGFRDGGTPGLGVKIPVDPDDVAIEPPEWLDGVRNNPAAHQRGIGPIQVKVKLNGPPNYACTLDATGTFCGIEDKPITFDGNGEYVASSFTTVEDIPTTVGKIDAGWQWRVTEGGTTRSINSTSHKVYFTFGDNPPSHWYRQLYEFGCTWASGQSNQSGVYNAIWSAIATRTATGYAYRHPLNDAFDTKYLILDHNGRCGAWMNFYRHLLGTQGIHVAGIGLIALPHRGYSRMRIYTSARGQGGGPDDNEYSDHAINRYANQYYDPSYGNGAFPEVVDWEDDSVKEFKEWWDSPCVPDVKGVQEVLLEVQP